MATSFWLVPIFRDHSLVRQILYSSFSFIFKSVFLLFILNFSFLINIRAQTEQQIENFAEKMESSEVEDDSYLIQLQQYTLHPINLNTADEKELGELPLLNDIQIKSLIQYRAVLGEFISIYELQAIPLWDIDLIEKIRPYVTVSSQSNFLYSIQQRLHNGDHSILARISQGLEKSKGYMLQNKDSFTGNYYSGSPQHLLLRYRYTFKNLLQYGVVAEKDAGEQFLKGAQRKGFDFYSAHFFVKNVGIIQSLALGDFTVNMGQGLVQWQSLAFKKGADVLNIKRQSSILRPYNAAGENNFHRGVGITLGKRHWQATVFASYKKIDGNVVDDTITGSLFISSLQTSGLHRTKSEIGDKAVQKQLTIGSNLSYTWNRLHMGVSTVRYYFGLPINKESEPYNLYALSGKSLSNYSIDYGYTLKNMHFFGEAAIDHNGNKGLINGALVSASSKVDLSMLYRNISSGYQSLYTNAFTENVLPTNEKGFYTGISIRPSSAWRLDAYVDFYKFPWLKYGVNASSDGRDYQVQLTYKPGKQLEIYSRFRTECKSINYANKDLLITPVVGIPKQNWRTHITYKVNTATTLRSRAEVVWYNNKEQPEHGFLIYFDYIYNPLLKPYSGNIRLQYFEADSYNSRLYAFENDVLYNFSIPVFYNKGYRYYININYNINKKLSCWLRWAQTIYKDQAIIGSGLDEISSNHKTDIKLQAIYHF